MHPAQRFADSAVFRLIAGTVFGEAVGQDYRAVDGPDYFEGADAPCVPSQFVAPIRACDRVQNTRPSELLQDLGEKRDGEMVGVGYVLGAGRCAWDRREVAQGDQAIVRFFGQLEHGASFE